MKYFKKNKKKKRENLGQWEIIRNGFNRNFIFTKKKNSFFLTLLVAICIYTKYPAVNIIFHYKSYCIHLNIFFFFFELIIYCKSIFIKIILGNPNFQIYTYIQPYFDWNIFFLFRSNSKAYLALLLLKLNFRKLSK